MVSFERAFDDVTNSCDEALKATQILSRQIRQLRKASQVGNIAQVKRAQARLADTLDELAQPVNDAVNAWPYDDEQELQHFQDGYAAYRLLNRERELWLFPNSGHGNAHGYPARENAWLQQRIGVSPA